MTEKKMPSIPWVEKYRPTSMTDVVLEPLNRKIFQNIIDKNYFPNLLLYGSCGTGKTTLIMNIINEYQSKYGRINKSNVIVLNSSNDRGIDVIRNQIHQFVKSNNLFESGLKFVILDEVDYMTKNAQQALKYILQSSNYNVRFCLMCNYITKIDESLKNEFVCIRFNSLPRIDILGFIKKITISEGFELTDETIYSVQNMFSPDIRSMINYIQLNQNILVTNMKNDSIVIDFKVIENIHSFILDKSNDAGDFLVYIHNLCKQYNIDKRSLIHKYLDYIIQNFPDIATSTFLKSIEIILHRHDIPMDVHLRYLLQLI
jgi:DNA polymerase III delta prime subunit